ncbi:MAG: serine/threonine protein kinase [Nannocystis sp.]|nr:serine/threonine-protein kinase [Nannocystis sp.]MBA3549749.1 serine/threonine protein kinase [Nannocystis sp.]
MSNSDDHPQADPLLGTTFARRYLIERRLGRGGMGVVYQATQVDLNRQVVLKVLAPDWMGDPEALARFEREARGLSSLQHPNIVTIHDFGRNDGRAFIVMEYVAGETLDRFVRRRTRLALADFVPIAAQVLKGLGEAHSRGIIHRDIKPANIMLCERQGRANYVKILDFGLAKLVSGSSDITKQNVLGTPTCLSPEQILGEKVDQRVDVYAVGILFYFMLSGVMPFQADNDASVLYKHVHEQAAPLADLLPADHGVPEGVLELISRCMEKSRERRPRDANEVVEGLIDQVPFSMFRLPRAQPRTEETPAEIEEPREVTGERSKPVLAAHEIQVGSFGRDREPAPAPSSSHSLPAAPNPLFSTGSVARPATAPPMMSSAFNNAALADQLKAQGIPMDNSSVFQVQDGRTVVLVGNQQQQQQERQRNLVYGGLAAAAVLGVGFFAFSGRGNADDPVVDRGAATANASGAELAEGDKQARLEDLLSSAEGLVDDNKFSQAQRVLDAAEDDLKRFPQLMVRASELSVRLETARMLASGRGFEQTGDKISALKIYRNVLGADAGNAEAQARIKALVGDAAFALMTFTVDGPPASITVDGVELGPAPITHPLSAGKHQLIVKADGYKTYQTTITVSAGKDEALKIPLEVRAATAPSNPPTSSKPQTPRKPPPVSEPQPPATKPKPKPKPDDDDGGLMSIPIKKGK